MAENKDKIHEARFLSLVLSLHNSAWIGLGKIANPVTGEVEKDLGAARGSIDLIETLRFKTRGNVTPEEEKVLASCLSSLQLNYVEESSRQEKAKGKEAPSGKGEKAKTENRDDKAKAEGPPEKEKEKEKGKEKG